jgi:ATP phosphoribosyltransferase
MDKTKLTLALTKGRILRETLPLLAQAGIEPLEDMSASRKLVFPTTRSDLQLVVMRGVDVPVYVRYGAADLGVVGKDTLLEQGAEGVYEPLDLGIAPCRLMTAAPVGFELPQRRLRVATKFVNIARDHFARRGVQVELIKLYGAMELAPAMRSCGYDRGHRRYGQYAARQRYGAAGGDRPGHLAADYQQGLAALEPRR